MDRIPRRLLRLLERVTDRDREWFLRHPGATHYVRPYVPGEFGLPVDDGNVA
jgi:hypothetical protein